MFTAPLHYVPRRPGCSASAGSLPSASCRSPLSRLGSDRSGDPRVLHMASPVRFRTRPLAAYNQDGHPTGIARRKGKGHRTMSAAPPGPWPGRQAPRAWPTTMSPRRVSSRTAGHASSTACTRSCAIDRSRTRGPPGPATTVDAAPGRATIPAPATCHDPTPDSACRTRPMSATR
jgi:hypothetical protein